MEPPEDDESISLLGEALQNLMASDDGPSASLIQAGDTMEFHHYMDLPSHVREMIMDEAVQQERISVTDQSIYWYDPIVSNHNLARLAPVSLEWQFHIEGYTFHWIRIDPSVECDVRRFKELFKKWRRSHLMGLDIIIDDRPTGPWHSANGMLQISQAMEKVGQFFRYLNLWDSDEPEDLKLWFSAEYYPLRKVNFGEIKGLEINFMSLNLGFPEIEYAPEGEPYIQTSSLWTESQLNLLTNSNLPTDMPLWAVLSAFPKRFGIAKRLTFPLDCVPFPATIAIMQKMSNLESCSFEVSFKRSSEEGMARLTDFVQQLPALLPALRDLLIRATDTGSAPTDVPESAYKLSAALRDNGQNLRKLKVEGIFMLQNFFEPFSVNSGLALAGSEWNWPNLEELDLKFVIFRPFSWPISSPDQRSLTPSQLLIAAGRAALDMPALKKLRASIHDDWNDDPYTGFFLIKRETSRNLESPRSCRVKLSEFTSDQEQLILSGWTPFMGAKARFVSRDFSTFDSDDEELWPTTVYQTFPEEQSLCTTFGSGALVHNDEFLKAQRLARTNLGI